MRKAAGIVASVIGLLLAAVVQTASAQPVLVVNEDNDHYFKQDASLMNEASLRAYVDGIAAGGKVTHLFFCVAGQRASYDSKVWEPIWKGLGGNGWSGKPENNIWCVNAKKLFDAGVDPYRVWIDRAREKGVSPWLSLRMNDAHGTTVSNHFRVSGFYWVHPEWTRVPGSKSSNWYDHAFDFAHPEVRDYTFAMAREIVERYRPDGLELDFMRVNAYFRDGEVKAGGPLMNDLVRRIRAVARREGAKLAVRVPDAVEACETIGLDVLTWCREGLVDWVIPCNYYYSMTFALPLADWQTRVAALNPAVTVIPGTGENVAFDHRGFSRADSAAYRGWASTMYSQGAKGIYLFNVAYHPRENKREPDLDRKIYATDLLGRKSVNAGERRFVRSFRDVDAPDAQHPAPDPVVSGVPLAVVLPEGTLGCSSAEVVIGCRKADAKRLAVSVNGVAAANPRDVFEPRKFGSSTSVAAWTVPPSALKGRENRVLVSFAGAVDVTWCEIAVR